MSARPPTAAEARTFDRIVRDPAFLRIWANSCQDRPWYYGTGEPRRVRIARIALQYSATPIEAATPQPRSWRQEAAALLGLALGTLGLAAGLVGGALWALGRLREAVAP